MKKYYHMAIELNDPIAMVNLGLYYQYDSPDFTLMKKYYDMAIELNEPNSMVYLGRYYINNDNQLSIKYFKMALEHKHMEIEEELMSLLTTQEQVEVVKKYNLSIERFNDYDKYHYFGVGDPAKFSNNH
jgi:TPR repeat protein